MARRRKKAKPPVEVDRLSALPDELLHQIMARGGIRAWEVARTCILSRRWRNVWASAPCVDLRVFCNGTHRPPPENFSRFVNGFLPRRDRRVSLDTLRLLHVPTECDHEMEDDEDHEQPTYDASDVAGWVTHAVQRGDARVIEVTDHPEHPGCFQINDDVSFASSHLQQLKLWHARLGGNTLEDVSFHCPCLQVLELKECILDGSTNISSDSLTSLTLEKCRIWLDLSVTAPNLVSLRCVKPFSRAPSFGTMGSLSTATIILLDSFLETDTYHICKEHPDSKLGLSYSGDDASYLYGDFYGSDTDSISTCQYGELADDDDDEHSSADSEDRSKNVSNSRLGGGHNGHGPPVSGGDELLLSISNVTTLDLIAAPGEDKDRAVAMSENNRQLTGRLLACAHLTKVKIIKCCEDDVRVNALVRLFVDSGMDSLLTSSTEVAL
ncbi:hypothetical protein ACQ4PT_070749 [Festuca glaucescens]